MIDHPSGRDWEVGNEDDQPPGITWHGSRILLIAAGGTGGLWTTRLTRDLTERGAAVHVIVPTWGPDVRAYREAGATVHFCRTTLPLAHPWRTTHVLWQLRRLVRQIDPEIIYPLHARSAVALRLAYGVFGPTGSAHHARTVSDASPLILGPRALQWSTQILEPYLPACARLAPGSGSSRPGTTPYRVRAGSSACIHRAVRHA
jgi:hypothetical protein